ncbi:MAG: tetratricopeptide repeat protein [Myxococcota bacterium]
MWLLLATIGVGFAQTPGEEESKALYEQGLRSYQQGDYVTAIRLWYEAYERAPVPAILHNIAKAHESANQPDEALAAWRAYREVAPPAEQATADARIAALQLVLALPPAPEAPRPAPSAVSAAPAPAPVPIERPHRSHRGLAVGLLATGATGLAATGAVIAATAVSNAGDAALDGCVRTSTGTLCDTPAAASLSQGRLWFGLGASLIGGGVALGAGTVVVAIGGPSAGDIGRVAFGGSF